MHGWAFQVPSYVLHFALGMLVAVIHVRQPARARQAFERWAPPIALAAAITVVVLVSRAGIRGLAGVEGPGDHHLRNTALATSFALLLLCIANGPDWIRRWLDVAPLRWLGQVSYGMYLYHVFLIGFALWAWGGPPIPPQISTNQMFFSMLGWTVVGTSLVSWASYVFLESPIRERCRTWAKSKQVIKPVRR